MDSLLRYKEALSKFSQPGNRFAMLPELTALGKIAGLTAEDIVADARHVGVANRDRDIRRMFDGSTVKTRNGGYSYRHSSYKRVIPKPAIAYQN